MALETTEKDTNIASEKLAITSNGGDHSKTLQLFFLISNRKFLQQ